MEGLTNRMTDKLLDYSPARYNDKIDAMYARERRDAFYDYEWVDQNLEDKRNTERLEAWRERRYGLGRAILNIGRHIALEGNQ